VLIVDDDEDSRTSLREVLEHALPDLRVSAAADADEALDVLGRGGVRLVISDYKMPGEDGLSLLLRASRIAPGAVRMLVTALPQASLPLPAIQAARVAHVVVKPFDTRSFVRLVTETLGQPQAAAAAP